MKQDELLNLGTELGYELIVSGAEVYRAEDSVGRLLRSYGSDSGEVFVIPSCIIVSLLGDGGQPVTRIRRIPPHGTDIDQLERCNDLSRRLCRETPDYPTASSLLEDIRRERRYPIPLMVLIGYFLGAFSFCMFFNGTFPEAILSGLCCVAIYLSQRYMDRMGSNSFFKTIAASTISTFIAAAFARIWPQLNFDHIAIGALMILVPGVCFTSALRDIMAGDMITGLSKAAEGILIGIAIVIGTGAATVAAGALWGVRQ